MPQLSLLVPMAPHRVRRITISSTNSLAKLLQISRSNHHSTTNIRISTSSNIRTSIIRSTSTSTSTSSISSISSTSSST